MALECPVCRQRVSFFRAFRTTAWGRFPCTACRSILGINVKRRFMSLIPFLPVMYILIRVIRVQDYGSDYVLVPVMILVFLLLLRFCERIVVIDERAFNCRECGYDLQGLTEPRCPECGKLFDPMEKERILARANLPAPRARGRWILVVLILVFIATLAAGIYVANRRRAAPSTAPPPPTSPASTP